MWKMLRRVALVLLIAAGLAEAAVRVFPIGAVYNEHRITMRRSFRAESPPLFFTNVRIRTDGATYVDVDRGSPQGADPLTTKRYPFAKPANVFRIVCVGDSLTTEWPFDKQYNYTHFLHDLVEKKLAPTHPGIEIEVIPLGIGGYNSWQELVYFEKYFGKLEADLILVQFCPNDADVLECPNCRQDADTHPDKDASQLVVLEHRRYVRNPPGFRSHLVARIQQQLAFRRTKEARVGDDLKLVPINDEMVRAFAGWKALSATRHIPLRVVMFPILIDNDREPEIRYGLSVLDRLGIGALDLTPGLVRERSLGRWAAEGDILHPELEGYEADAKLIFSYLESERLLPP